MESVNCSRLELERVFENFLQGPKQAMRVGEVADRAQVPFQGIGEDGADARALKV